MPQKSPHPVDVHVGRRLRLRRKLLGMTQIKLGEAVGLTYQQIHKYEKGANRIGSGRLYDFSETLEVPVGYFFDDMPPNLETNVDGDNLPSPENNAVVMRDETQLLVTLYYSAKTPRLRKSVFELIKALARSDEEVAANPL